MKDPLPIQRFIPPANLRIGFKPGPLPLCIVAGIRLDLPDRLIPFHLLQKKLNQLFITQTLHGLQLGSVTHLHQPLDLFEESPFDHPVDPLLNPPIELLPVHFQADLQ